MLTPMELEHSIGFCGKFRGALHLHPTDNTVVFAQGGFVVIGNLHDAHDQKFLRGHDDQISCLALSKNGNLIASGQTGERADVIVWDYATQTPKYRLQEHDEGVQLCVFTDDERFLLTVGHERKMYVWDMLTGMIVAKTSALKPKPVCACWGGRARDIKGRDTTNYQLATGGDGQLTFWTLDPHAGSLTPLECQLGTQVRNFTTLAFSWDATYLFAGSTSSDFTAVHVKHRVMHSTTVCGSNGVTSLLAQSSGEHGDDRIVVGCGDGTVAIFEGQRNGNGACRTYSRGPVESCTAQVRMQQPSAAAAAAAVAAANHSRLVHPPTDAARPPLAA